MEMTEITRQHLEDAALAAGHEVACSEAAYHNITKSDVLHLYGLILRGEQDAWRPHLDDGDAFRLMAAIRGAIEVRKHDSWAAVADYDGDRPGALMEVEHDGTPSDAARAAREAIVLCAAAVGERMRKGGA
jgi:hypothetical protein